MAAGLQIAAKWGLNMRKKTKITIDPKYILVVLLLFCIAVGIVSYRFADKMAL